MVDVRQGNLMSQWELYLACDMAIDTSDQIRDNHVIIEVGSKESQLKCKSVMARLCIPCCFAYIMQNIIGEKGG